MAVFLNPVWCQQQNRMRSPKHSWHSSPRLKVSGEAIGIMHVRNLRAWVSLILCHKCQPWRIVSSSQIQVTWIQSRIFGSLWAKFWWPHWTCYQTLSCTSSHDLLKGWIWILFSQRRNKFWRWTWGLEAFHPWSSLTLGFWVCHHGGHCQSTFNYLAGGFVKQKILFG